MSSKKARIDAPVLIFDKQEQQHFLHLLAMLGLDCALLVQTLQSLTLTLFHADVGHTACYAPLAIRRFRSGGSTISHNVASG